MRGGIKVTLISGGEPFAALARTSAERVIQLPPIRARDAGFKVRGMDAPDGGTIFFAGSADHGHNWEA